MKGEKQFKILNFLSQAGEVASDLVWVMLTAPYGSSFRKLEYLLGQEQSRRVRSQEDARKRKAFKNLLSSLKRDGLIGVRVTDETQVISLTAKGNEIFKSLNTKTQDAIQSPCLYKASHETQLTLVTFDIPETRARERVWLRRTLIHLGFSMLQKSVWFGNHKLPIELLKDLHDQKLLEHVEILAITKSGSIRRLTSKS